MLIAIAYSINIYDLAGIPYKTKKLPVVHVNRGFRLPRRLRNDALAKRYSSFYGEKLRVIAIFGRTERICHKNMGHKCDYDQF